MRRLETLLTTTLLLPVLACGAGNDEASGPVNDTLGSSTLAASFVAEAETLLAGTVWLAENASTGDLVTVKVSVTGVDDIYATGFDLEFDPAAVAFVNWSPGDLLEESGEIPIYQVRSEQGRVIVGASRTGGAVGVDVAEPRVLIYLTFRAIRLGSSGASLDNGTLLRPGTNAPEPIPDMIWIGGRFNAI